MDFTTEEERRQLEAVISDFSSKGMTMNADVDPDWFFEETGDEDDRMDRLMLFMLFYFPRSFRTWEPINHMFFHFLEFVHKGVAKLPGQHGKDLDCATPILTVDGWKTMGTIEVGDTVYAGDGTKTQVIYCSEIFADHRCYELTFADGTCLTAGEDHLWWVYDDADHGKWKAITTSKIASSTWRRKRSGGRLSYRYRVGCDAIVDTPSAELPIDPYIFGYWLGDGTSANSDLTVGVEDLPHIRQQVEVAGYRIVSELKDNRSTASRVRVSINAAMRDGFMARAKRLGVLGNKHIPEIYLTASIEQRLDLLAGMMDSDGSITHGRRSPQVELSLTSDRLASDALRLLRSLGIKTRIGKRNRMLWTPIFDPFRMERKSRQFLKPAQNTGRMSIIDIHEVASRPTRCIQVAHPDHVFLVGHHFTPTHNTTMLWRWAGAWIPAQEPNISMIYTEKNSPTAFKRSRACRMMLQENALLIDHFGQFQPPPSSSRPWSDEQWTIAQRNETIDTPTMAVFGAGGASLLGNRCNILIVDDPVTPENSRSDIERDNLWQWHSEAASTCPEPLPIDRSRYLVKEFLVGTVFRRDDLYHRCEATGEYEVLYLPAVIDEVLGTTLSPRYCYIHPDELERKARVSDEYDSLYQAVKDRKVKNLYQWMTTHGRTAFNRRYQNVAINVEDQWCKESWIKGGGEDEKEAPAGGWPGCLDTDRRMGEVKDNWIYVTGCDPQSGSKKPGTARFAALTLGADPADPTMRHIVDIDVGRYPLESDNPAVMTQAKILVRHAKTYHSKVIIEDNAQQAGWQGVFKRNARDAGIVASCEGSTTDNKKTNKDLGVMSMAPLFENGYMRFPYGNASSQRLSNELIDELVFWGVNPTSDIVMALWFANSRLERMLKAAKVATHNRTVVKPYVNRLATTRYPQHWTEEQIEGYEAELQRRRSEEDSLEGDMEKSA